jgi:hypothetical protein
MIIGTMKNVSTRARYLILLTWWMCCEQATGSSSSSHSVKPHDVMKNPDDEHITLFENERLDEYRKRNYTWPLDTFVPNTIGWKSLMEDRFGQISEMEQSGDRYEGYLQLVHTALLAPNFTEYGFGLGRCPGPLLDALRQGIYDGLPTARYEVTPQVIEAPNQPLFIDRPDLTDRVLHDLRGYAEEWAGGIPLTPYRAYGFRLYQNESKLNMHVDKPQTHIISFILHIASSDDAEPWPIVIEDFHGTTHEVILTPGDILFYESSKCFHGRPRTFNGSWYSSVFVHYYPTYGWYDINHKLEAHYAVPPIWNQPPKKSPKQQQHNRLVMKGTSLKEPDCTPDDWCRLATSIKWSGPGQEGYIVAPNGEKNPFLPSTMKDEL